ncbi:transposase [Nonomuraea sp. M3C6]|uniref:Transposase n=1 Tax=Nonomuraea marmarensis TaxID=3351344 RepID=A0ABW7AUD1_9ACTN
MWTLTTSVCAKSSRNPAGRAPDKAPERRPVPDRQCLQGVLFVLHAGIGWEDLPQELGFGPGMTCWRLKCWNDPGVFNSTRSCSIG